MTTLIYHDNIIAADSLQFICSGSNVFPIRGPKVFLSKDKTFAYGICGYYFAKKDTERFEQWIEEQLVLHTKGLRNKRFAKKTYTFYIVVMTKNHTYVINNTERAVSVTAIDESDYFVNGTGGDYAVIHILRGASAVDAVQEAIKIDTASGCDVYAVKRSSLKKHEVI